MRALIIAVVTLCSISAAGAQDPAGLPIPAGNVDAVCGRIGHPVSRAECVRAEQLNYDLVKSIWPNASEHAKLISIKKSEPFLNTTAYFNSIYTQLLAAMIDDQDAIDRTAPPKFMR